MLGGVRPQVRKILSGVAQLAAGRGAAVGDLSGVADDANRLGRRPHAARGLAGDATGGWVGW